MAVSVWEHTEARRVRLEKALANERADPVEAPVGPNTEAATESQESAPAAQQEPASSSSGPAAPMPNAKTFRTSRWIHQWSWDHKNAENAKERGQARRQQVKSWKTSGEGEDSVTSNDRADSGRFGNRCPLYSCVTEQDEMTIGGLYVIDGIDVVATLVPEEDVWQFEATETCTTETQMQDREQKSIAVVDYEDPSATEAIEAFDTRTSEKLDSEDVRKVRAKEVRELEFEVEMEVDESEMRSTLGMKIWSEMGGNTKGPKQSSNTMSSVCHGSEHKRIEI